jgi:hypothetical protein
LKDIYADADQTELMKMAVRMPDAMKIERWNRWKWLGTNQSRNRGRLK